MSECTYILLDKNFSFVAEKKLLRNIYGIRKPVCPVIAKVVFKRTVARINYYPFPEKYRVSHFYVQQLADLSIGQYGADPFAGNRGYDMMFLFQGFI